MARKGNKYKARKTIVDGLTFDSSKEAERYLDLKEQAEKGQIRALKLQVPYELIPNQYIETEEIYKKGPKKGQHKSKLQERSVSYIADFVYEKKNEDGTYEEIVEDVKGYKKGAAYSIFKIKKKMMLDRYGIVVAEF